jgi:hypothetical protein
MQLHQIFACTAQAAEVAFSTILEIYFYEIGNIFLDAQLDN